jgi:hypothetical protein
MRATNLNNLFAVSLLIFAIEYLAIPAWASVDITAAVDAEDDCLLIISFDATSEPNLIRSISLNIQADNDANITEVLLLNAEYNIHPGTIVIDTSGNVTDQGTPVAPQSDLPSDTLAGLDSNGVTIEMASLYAPVGPASPNAPSPSGDLVSVRVDNNCTLTITANVSRAGSSGVVMESPDEVVTINLPAPVALTGCGCPCVCLKDTHFGFNAWMNWDMPECWCYRKQCRGDINGSSFLGKPVSLADLTTFKLAFGQIDAVLATVTDGICADLNHSAFLGKRVTLSDLNTFKTYFGIAEASVPCCDADQDCVLDAGDIYNYWTN